MLSLLLMGYFIYKAQKICNVEHYITVSCANLAYFLVYMAKKLTITYLIAFLNFQFVSSTTLFDPQFRLCRQNQ